MTDSIEPQPAAVDAEELEARLRELIGENDPTDLESFVEAMPSDLLTHAVANFEDEERRSLLAQIDPEVAAEIIELIPEPQAVAALEDLPAATAAQIVHELPSDEQADLINEVDNPDQILAELDPEEAAEIRELAVYAEDTAGGLMGTEFLAFPVEATVEDVVHELRRTADQQRDYGVQYAYVVDRKGRLLGVLRLRDLLVTPGLSRIEEIMVRDPASLPVEAPLDRLRSFFDAHAFLGAPVVEADGRLVGVARRVAVDAALAERSESDYRRTQGIIGGEELRSMPTLVRSRRRLAWLSLNITLNVAAASIIAAHQDVVQAVIALAVFLPIISDMSGCSGNQAVAVSMRELALNVARPGDVLHVLWKELQVGLLNGLALGALLGIGAYFWQGNPWLGCAVGAALALNTLVAVAIGGTIPLLLKRLGLDPALASGPILTTVTDMCGFMILLSFAAALLPHLG